LCRRRGWGRGRAPKLRPVYSPGRDACPPIWEVFPCRSCEHHTQQIIHMGRWWRSFR